MADAIRVSQLKLSESDGAGKAFSEYCIQDKNLGPFSYRERSVNLGIDGNLLHRDRTKARFGPRI